MQKFGIECRKLSFLINRFFLFFLALRLQWDKPAQCSKSSFTVIAFVYRVAGTIWNWWIMSFNSHSDKKSWICPWADIMSIGTQNAIHAKFITYYNSISWRNVTLVGGAHHQSPSTAWRTSLYSALCYQGGKTSQMIEKRESITTCAELCKF